ncbi:hypothetical protein Aab01nite_73320 [Paractinoplanes abujensis]|uniref:Uncharacterized protein n=1 Tax=Paractinoplanes abujensis TaxID=882441 RepID=A0A7W7CUP1_9ACTN|nr:hypothetical protein [Actinoplanes abujensis]MBB4695010.1 hypothetical protein [Actinoplanes abujensis]GID23742.1 hypothetical protein Aab01nite_73320 [Actinoplanes abujensis]
MTTVEKDRTTRTEAAAIMPFGGWESTPTGPGSPDDETLFRFPAPDDPAPSTARVLTMALWGAGLGLTAAGVGVTALVTVFGGAAFWYVPTLALFGLLSVALAVAAFLSIHRPVLPWLLLAGATAPLALDVLIAALY